MSAGSKDSVSMPKDGIWSHGGRQRVRIAFVKGLCYLLAPEDSGRVAIHLSQQAGQRFWHL